jgi:LacI family transcriptional regulator
MGKTHKPAVTIQDVARLAGVSPSSVSNVFNSRPGASKETIERVRKAAEELDYRPNSVARSLRIRHTQTVGIITDDIEGVFTTTLMRGIEDACTACGFSVFLCNSYGDEKREQFHLRALLDKQVDGVIMLSGYKVHERGALAEPLGKLPLVYLYQYTHELPIPCILPDDFGGGVLGTEHLIGLGHRRIGLINGPDEFEVTAERLAGYRQALERAHIPYDPRLVRHGEWTQASGYTLTKELLALPEPPTAIFCMSDLLAIGVEDALHELGCAIPQDVAVVSFDNRFFAANQRPPLTDVALPLYEMGKLAGEMIITQIQKKGKSPSEGIIRLPCKLVIRESSESPEKTSS